MARRSLERSDGARAGADLGDPVVAAVRTNFLIEQPVACSIQRAAGQPLLRASALRRLRPSAGSGLVR